MTHRLGPGDRVALLVAGSPAYVDLVLLATRQGVVPVPLDPRLTHREQKAVLGDVDPAVVVRDATDSRP